MELNTSSLKSGGLSPPDCDSDPDEKEISDDDDDDRNHKHRRRDTGSQSLERDSLEQALTQPYRKRNRPFENGQNDPQSHHNINRDFKRRLSGPNFSRFSGEHGSGRGRGRDFQWDSRFGSIDIGPQMAHPGPIRPGMFAGRGLPVSNPQGASWSSFGLVPNIPNGARDSMNPLGLPGILGPQMNPSMNMGIQRQRCRDFEERGFCLRGDMCPMEHGVNRIVVEDVQSLSQFNLPVSLPSAQMPGTSAGIGFVSSVSSTLINSRGPHHRTNKSSMDEEVLASAVNASGADLYDPDQPLWNNDARETSSPQFGLQPSNFDNTGSFVGADLSDPLIRSSGDVIDAQGINSSVWGRLRNSKNKPEMNEKADVRTKASDFTKSSEIRDPSSGIQGKSHVKLTNGAISGPKTVVSTSKLQNDVGGTVRKPSQKAQRTLFVNCIPLKDNKRENLLSHFRKFGEVIDIFIPANSERAFVQFSKREEAEKALKAPDAVMGSRFIKLWWANRDSIADNCVSSANNASYTPHDVMTSSGSPLVPAANRGKNSVQYPAPKEVVLKASDSSVTAGNEVKPVALNSPKAVPPAQKKMENLELLKEELRKKQEMLERRRSEFRQQLDKLTKQASGKSEVPAVLAEKRLISETSSDALKAGNTQLSDVGISMPSSEAELSTDKTLMENLASQRVKAKSASALQGPPISEHPIQPLASLRAPSHINRYKLDNRPKTFRIGAPLPCRLTDVAVLRDHFSVYGEISNVEVEDSGEEESHNDLTDSEAMRKCSARVSFVTRNAAERAFVNGRSWHGHNLHLSWVTSSISATSRSSGESSSALKGTLNIEVQSAEKTVHEDSQNTMDPKERISSPPPKSSNEHSCDSSQSSGKRNSPVAAAENHSHSEVQSPDPSIGHQPMQTNDPEIRDSEREEKESTRDDLKPVEDLGAG